jgi:UDP-galactopyranose mutase
LQKNNNILIVGAGLSGATIARELAENGYEVLIIDKKQHIAGHCFDFISSDGIRIHKYGPHIFHTSNQLVIDWLKKFTKWVNYEHKVLAKLNNGETVPFPPNIETLKSVGYDDLIDTFYRPYTEKMWGKSLEELNPKIINRVPIRSDDEDRYFPKDKFQKLPYEGYTKLVENILTHPSIKIQLNTCFDESMQKDVLHTFNSMPIDEYFNFCFGELPYRSIKFHHRTLDKRKENSNSVINFTDKSKYTRETEWKNFPAHGNNPFKTQLTKEEPCDYRDNNFERYYPIIDADGENRKKYNKYKKIIPKNTTFIGRCGQYVYIDMDQAISSSLALSRKFMESRGIN